MLSSWHNLLQQLEICFLFYYVCVLRKMNAASSFLPSCMECKQDFLCLAGLSGTASQAAALATPNRLLLLQRRSLFPALSHIFHSDVNSKREYNENKDELNGLRRSSLVSSAIISISLLCGVGSSLEIFYLEQTPLRQNDKISKFLTWQLRHV